MHRGLHSNGIPLTFAQHQIGRSVLCEALLRASAREQRARVEPQGMRAKGMIMFNRGCSSSLAKWLCFSLALVLALFSATPARAQVSGATLSGLITDENGGPGPGAAMVIKNVGTGVTRDVVTNADGFYSSPNLLPGSYEVRVTATGFQTLAQKGITLTVGAQQALNLSLKVGQLNQTVEVNAAPPDVQTTSSTISATVDSITVRQLPLNGRDWTSLATLEPGVVSVPNQSP